MYKFRSLVAIAFVLVLAVPAYIGAEKRSDQNYRIVSCGIASEAPGTTDELPLSACGGYSAGMKLYSPAVGRTVAFTGHGAKQANSKKVPVEHVLDGGSVKKSNGYIYVTKNTKKMKYSVIVASDSHSIVTVTASSR